MTKKKASIWNILWDIFEIPWAIIRQYIGQRNKEAVEAIKYDKARETLNAIMKKHGISDPDKAEFVDSITALLSKWSKN